MTEIVDPSYVSCGMRCSRREALDHQAVQGNFHAVPKERSGLSNKKNKGPLGYLEL